MHASTTEEKAILTLQLLKECWEKIMYSEISSEELDTFKNKIPRTNRSFFTKY